MNDIDDQQSDDLYPHDGTTFQLETPEKEAKDERAEKGKVSEGIEFLEERIGYLEERIAFYDSVQAVPDEVKVDPDKFMHVVAAHGIVIKELQFELDYLKELRTRYHR